ncbi:MULTISPECIES: hypothetical protein [unclassified Trinickia]|jgi:hypothetical protein|uniref:hypothetical protein n=1 Tax=unclassified Trinickia TaxID=2638168 RepID=UPI002404B2D6|nr:MULTISPECIES: hypothetical protein [unclassified Trinickia]MDG0027401.1 hypothetical protein [Trinickia sp. Y13]HVW50553.1 hypothetical protein [Trinickia sp.]
MTTIYLVKSGEQYLGPGEDGDIGLTPSIEEAEHFLSYEEAERAAHENAEPGYQIITRHSP